MPLGEPAKRGRRPSRGGLAGPSPRRAVELVIVVAAPSDCRTLAAILRRLPPSFSLPIAVLHPRPPTLPDSFANVLRRLTSLDVVVVRKSGVALEPRTVYVAPAHLPIYVAGDGKLALGDAETSADLSLAAHLLLATAAVELGPGVAVLVLPGAQAATARAATIVQRRGGIVIRVAAVDVVDQLSRLPDAAARAAGAG